MTQIYTLEQIKRVSGTIDVAPLIEAGFAAYSEGRVVVPPVGELSFIEPPGDTHIKYGYIKGDDCFVVKIASGFYDNPRIGLPSNSGLMLVFSQKSGMLQAVLLDEGYLTDVRTAVAGRVAATYLAPADVDAIGIVGTGIQARMQVVELKAVTACRKLVVWGRDEDRLAAYRADMEREGFSVETTMEAADIGRYCNLIVTATPSSSPILEAAHIRPGTHITAMGADTESKQELDSDILAGADLVVADSIPQCVERGEIARALKNGCITQEHITELGQIITGAAPGRSNDGQITVADLTGVAVQDIQIARAVCDALAGEDTQTGDR